MLKFFLHVDSIKLRLKSGMLDVLVKQQAVRLVICPQREIINGLALIGTSAEFHIPTKESLLTIQVILSVSNDRKFAGETSLVIDEYEPNVPYHKEAKLVNSADKSAAILFGFYYFHCGREEVSRPLCSAQGFTEIVTGMKNQNNSLFQENRKLESQVSSLKRLNESLTKSNSQLRANLHQKSQEHFQSLKELQINIAQYKQESQQARNQMREIYRTVMEKGSSSTQSHVGLLMDHSDEC